MPPKVKAKPKPKALKKIASKATPKAKQTSKAKHQTQTQTVHVHFADQKPATKKRTPARKVQQNKANQTNATAHVQQLRNNYAMLTMHSPYQDYYNQLQRPSLTYHPGEVQTNNTKLLEQYDDLDTHTSDHPRLTDANLAKLRGAPDMTPQDVRSLPNMQIEHDLVSPFEQPIRNRPPSVFGTEFSIQTTRPKAPSIDSNKTTMPTIEKAKQRAQAQRQVRYLKQRESAARAREAKRLKNLNQKNL